MAATAVHGHVAPTLTTTEDLLARGHGVVFLTRTAFANASDGVCGTTSSAQWRTSLQRVLARPGNTDTVVLLESAFRGAAPGPAGAPGPAPRGYPVVGVVPLTLTSVDLAPFGSGLPPARTDVERAACAEAAREHGLFAGVQEAAGPPDPERATCGTTAGSCCSTPVSRPRVVVAARSSRQTGAVDGTRHAGGAARPGSRGDLGGRSVRW